MFSYYNNKLGLRIGICCIVIVMIAVLPTQANRSRVLTIGLFASGVALKFGGVFVANSAQDSYDQYLFTGIQSDLATHRDDYTTKRDLSVAMSRTGIAFAGLAVLVSVFDQLDVISDSRSVQLSLKPNYNPRTGDAVLILQRKF